MADIEEISVSDRRLGLASWVLDWSLPSPPVREALPAKKKNTRYSSSRVLHCVWLSELPTLGLPCQKLGQIKRLSRVLD